VIPASKLVLHLEHGFALRYTACFTSPLRGPQGVGPPTSTLTGPCRARVKTYIGYKKSMSYLARLARNLLILGSAVDFSHRLCRAISKSAKFAQPK
jgi:hypothetical protein